MHPAWVRVPIVAVVIIAVVFFVDALSSVDGTPRGLLRGVMLLSAVVVAGTFFQRWSVLAQRDVAHHAMAALGMLGGALVASSVLSTGAGVFGNGVTGALGVTALVIAVAAARASLASDTGVGR